MGQNLPENVSFDTFKIERVLDNLITNAVKFSDRKTTIRVALACKQGRLTIEVSDQGRGIVRPKEKVVPELVSPLQKKSSNFMEDKFRFEVK